MTHKYRACEFCRRQALRIEELEEEVRQLRAEVYNSGWEPPPWLRLSPMELDIIRALLKSGERPCSKEFLLAATRLSPATREDAEPKVIGTVICKMRPRLRQQGIEIETLWGRGFRLHPDSRARLLDWQQEQRKAA